MAIKENEDGHLINDQTSRKVLPAQSSAGILGEIHVPITKTADSMRCEAVCRPHLVPVIFVPGIMGSNLSTSSPDAGDTKRPDGFVWNPSDMVKMGGYIFSDGEARQKKLNPINTKVTRTVTKGPGCLDPHNPQKDREEAERLGWGTVDKGSYWPILKMLHEVFNAEPHAYMLAPFYSDGGETASTDEAADADKTAQKPAKDAVDIKGLWQKLKKDGDNGYKNKTTLNMRKGEDAALTEQQVKHAAAYTYMIYAAGYNWLRSNYDSATGPDEWTLKNIVEQALKYAQAQCDHECKQVIIVTHSMGGLVARAYAKENEAKVAGVIHGVMPAVGAPAMYKRMRAGFGGVEGFSAAALVLGGSASRVSAVLAGCVGALELAPSQDYGRFKTDFKQWLCILNADGSKLRLPKMNPYEEIYKSDEWYSLIPPIASENPSDGRNTRVNPANLPLPVNGSATGDLAYFKWNVALAQKFHLDYMPYNYYHPNTYVTYMADKTGVLKCFEKIEYQVTGGRIQSPVGSDYGGLLSGDGSPVITDNPLNNSEINPITEANNSAHRIDNDSGHGAWDLYNDGQVKHIEVQGSGAGIGDGTVPEDSGRAPMEFVKAIFEQSDGNPKHEHQYSWVVPAAQRMAMYSVVKIMQDDKRASE